MALAQGLPQYTKLTKMDPSIERPSSALTRGVQITEFNESRVNPEPVVIEDADLLMEQHLSSRKLRLITGVDNLEDVRSLELKVDTSETSLGNFGALLPNLVQLKLSNSIIPYVRDLGSSLRNITILWMSRCGLQELDGAASMLNLNELYLSYNELCDISPLSMLDKLQILDLEGNNIDDITQLQYLELCQRLTNLTLEGNPACVQPNPYTEEEDYDYRSVVQKVLPKLKYLDEELLTEGTTARKKSNVFDADWAYLEELQKDAVFGSADTLSTEDEGPSQPDSALRPATSYRPGTALRPTTGYRPLTASRRPYTVTGIKPATPVRPQTARPGTSERPDSSEKTDVTDATSDLTRGNVVCGNISKALRSRKQHNPSAIKETTDINLFVELKHKPEHTYDKVYDDVDDDEDRKQLLEELKSWRREHDEWMDKLQESRKPQVLVVDHNEHDDSFSVSSSDGDDEDLGINEVDSDDDDDLEYNDTGDTYKNRQSALNRRLKHDESFELDKEESLSPITSQNSVDKEINFQKPLLAGIKPSKPLPSMISKEDPLLKISREKRHLPLSENQGNSLASNYSSGQNVQPVIKKGGEQMPTPPIPRPVTARAVLMGARGRRQLPQVPSTLPSKHNVPKPE